MNTDQYNLFSSHNYNRVLKYYEIIFNDGLKS